MKTELLKTCCVRGLLLVAAMLLLPPQARAHVVAPEQFHPVVESYRRGMLTAELEQLKSTAAASSRDTASKHLELSRQYWAGFEYEVKSTDQPMFREIGLCWLKLGTALGNAPLLGQGETPLDAATVQHEADEILAYVKLCYADFHAPESRARARPGKPAPLSPRNCRRGAISTSSVRVRVRFSISSRAVWTKPRPPLGLRRHDVRQLADFRRTRPLARHQLQQLPQQEYYEPTIQNPWPDEA